MVVRLKDESFKGRTIRFYRQDDRFVKVFAEWEEPSGDIRSVSGDTKKEVFSLVKNQILSNPSVDTVDIVVSRLAPEMSSDVVAWLDRNDLAFDVSVRDDGDRDISVLRLYPDIASEFKEFLSGEELVFDESKSVYGDSRYGH